MSDSTPRFSTGIPFIDKEFGGGIPAGDVVAIIAPPDSQSELLTQELARAQTMHYFSTVCQDEGELRELIEPPDATGDSDITTTYVETEAFLQSPEDLFGDLPEESCLVVDPMDELETGTRSEYLAALNVLKRELRATGSIAFVHCLDGEDTPELRSLTLKRADHVWRLRQEIESGELTTTLYIPKSRDGVTITDAIKMELTDKVRIDTSRNIA